MLPPTSPRFDRLILVRDDGTRLVVEDDGEVWTIASSSRRLVRAIPVRDLEALRVALAAARPESWPADAGAASPGSAPVGAGSRLVLEAGGSRRAIVLPSSDASVSSLVRLIESFAP